MGMDGPHLAATTIQKNWRRYRDRNAYLKYRRRKWAAGVIALSWLTYVKMSKARVELKKTRIRQLENFRKRNRVCFCTRKMLKLIEAYKFLR